MPLEQIIPFESKGGNQYLISFKVFESGIDFGIPIIDVSLVLVESITVNISISELFSISELVFEYLNNNDVVLYYYCDITEIKRSYKNKNMLPQEFRNILFTKLFEKKRADNMLKNDIVIHNEKNNDIHYISLISSNINKKKMTEISNEVSKMNDK